MDAFPLCQKLFEATQKYTEFFLNSDTNSAPVYSFEDAVL